LLSYSLAQGTSTRSRAIVAILKRTPFRQHLPDLDLSIERYTNSVPGDGRWYLLRAGEQLGRYRTLKEAKLGWHQVVQDSGWSPRKQDVNAKAVLRQESAERWARNRAG
jgi:hypothetical protein